MDRMLDAADAAYWWLRNHLAVAAGLVVAVVAGLVALATLPGGGADAPKIPSGAVAVVGDAPITREQLARWQEIYTKGAQGADPQAAPDPEGTRKAAFELLAGSTFILQEAEREDVDVPESRVKEGVDAYFTQSGATTQEARSKILGELGIAEEDLAYQQRVSLLSAALREKVAEAVPQPSSDVIAAAYEREPERWARPSQRDLRAVVSADEESAKKARAALEKGLSYAKVTKAYSVDASLAEGKGVIKGLKPGTSAPDLERAVFKAPKGELQGPVPVDGGWVVFEVTDVKALKPQDLQAATPAIRGELRALAQNKATNEYVTGLRTRWKARTRCMPTVEVPEFCSTA